jgi:hypothetical protein
MKNIGKEVYITLGVIGGLHIWNECVQNLYFICFSVSLTFSFPHKKKLGMEALLLSS